MEKVKVAIRRYYVYEDEITVDWQEDWKEIEKDIYNNDLIYNSDIYVNIVKDLTETLEKGEMLDHNIYMMGAA